MRPNARRLCSSMSVGEKKPVSSQYRTCLFDSPVRRHTCSAVNAIISVIVASPKEFTLRCYLFFKSLPLPASHRIVSTSARACRPAFEIAPQVGFSHADRVAHAHMAEPAGLAQPIDGGRG